jgi:hypothetical protein
MAAWLGSLRTCLRHPASDTALVSSATGLAALQHRSSRLQSSELGYAERRVAGAGGGRGNIGRHVHVLWCAIRCPRPAQGQPEVDAF